MTSDPEWHNSGDEHYGSARPTRKSKRRKVTQKGRNKAVAVRAEEPPPPSWSLGPLLEALHEQTAHDREDDQDGWDPFECIIEPLLPSLLHAENAFFQWGEYASEKLTPHLLPRSRAEELHQHSTTDPSNSVLASMFSAKSRTHSRLLRRVVLNRTPSYLASGPLTPVPAPRAASAVNPVVLDALYAIRTTPYESSFLSRLQGFSPSRQPGVIAIDWDTRTPWMELMADIREHYSLAHPEREQAGEIIAPITYCTLLRCHLDQVHDLLGRVFWEGADVTDSLDYSPEKSTIVAMYKQLVVGAAFLSSPQETYITYLAVRSGWESSQIATSMLYHLISLNPHKDITLHVSINNPAMLLYNRFGFKAEEFIVGFYEDYLDPNSPQSKNAFRLRLRRW
ncbi:hypothetical protein LXA43DRAFT_218154 [Ganoderma leucocontextum]|nr:hypothetical protein LXA43DRAFT_218154 [Ganoderma leucocontextum]